MPPSSRNPFQIHLMQPQRLHVQIHERIDDTGTLVNRVVDALAEHRQVTQVLVDMRNVNDWTETARVGLGTLQKLLARRQLRTAWIVGSGRTHGLARFIVVRAADSNAATFTSLSSAEEWLATHQGRVAQLLSKVDEPG